jgi:hypothetical protein
LIRICISVFKSEIEEDIHVNAACECKFTILPKQTLKINVIQTDAD